jgi:hypothetical protein
MDIQQQMNRHPWFAGLGANLQAELLANSRVQRLGVGEFLSRQGDLSGCFYGLVIGLAKRRCSMACRVSTTSVRSLRPRCCASIRRCLTG